MTTTPEETFLALLEQHAGILHKVAGTYSRTAEDRRDLVQEITAQLWKAFPRYDRERKFSTWMYRVALNVAISSLRSVSRRDRHFISLGDLGAEPADDRVPEPEAEREMLPARERIVATFGPAHTRSREISAELVKLYERWGRPGDADRWRAAARDTLTSAASPGTSGR